MVKNPPSVAPRGIEPLKVIPERLWLCGAVVESTSIRNEEVPKSVRLVISWALASLVASESVAAPNATAIQRENAVGFLFIL